MAFQNYRKASKSQFGREVDSITKLDLDEINTGSLMRIADAAEMMAQNYVTLQNNYEYMRKSRDEHIQEVERMSRRISALQGVITKLKRKTGRG